MSEEKKHSETAQSTAEAIDLSKITPKVKVFFDKSKAEHYPEGKAHSSHSSSKQESEDSLSINLKQVTGTVKKHAKWLIPLACILFAVIVSVYLRTMPQRMPIADQWAEDDIANYYQGLIKQLIDQQHIYLPEQNKQALVDKEWQNFQKQNKENLAAQEETLSRQYRDSFKDDQGTLYLLGVDPYYFYRQAYYVLENGIPGTGYFEDGMIKDDYRLAPIGGASQWSFHNWFSAQWHKFMNFFGDFPLMYTFFFVGVLFSALTVIPGFFIGKKLTKNNVGGFFTAFLLAVTSFFVARTTGESSDTDVYAVFFPILIIWLFLEALDAKELKWKLILISLAGFATGLFAFAWSGWWSIALFLLATLIFQIAYTLALHWKNVKTAITSKEIKDISIIFVAYTTNFIIFANLFVTFHDFLKVLYGPFRFRMLKTVTTFWPNIRTTVAELNVVPLSNVIEALGGKLLFFMAIIGIVILLLKKNEHGKREPHLGFLLALWLASSLFATTKGVRFILQVTPIFAIAVGVCMGFLWYYTSQWLSKQLKLNTNMIKTIIFLLLAILLISPAKAGYSQAHYFPSGMNDAWYNTLTKIKEEAPKNIVITSWWDLGHWFRAVADRPVTFDGGTQTPWGAYWVGRSLLVDNEKATVGIVRMLNCGQNTAFDELDKVLNDTPKSVQLLNEIVVLDKNAAIQKLTQAGLTDLQATTVVKYTHCDNPPEDFYITSEDMVGKAGVWGHFGSWDFNRAMMYQKTKKLERSEAVALLTKEFGVTEEAAEQLHAEIKSTDGDRWISPWPGHITGTQGCEKKAENKLRCTGSAQRKNFIINIDLTDYSAKFESQDEVYPNSIVYAAKNEIVEKKFSGNTAGFSIILIPMGSDYAIVAADTLQGNSMFSKLYFLQGHGLKCFSKFDEVQNINGGRIITWRVDYNCQQNAESAFSAS
ncbi:MAG: STT3 domain-containing protein [Nanoarchaeota archaeon]|nr:STT3 domain-containing protein [Nanoarchaeota archaeon]